MFPGVGGGSEQTHRPAGGENQAAARQTGEAESVPANTAAKGEQHIFTFKPKGYLITVINYRFLTLLFDPPGRT